MKVSRPRVEGGLLLCLFLFFVKNVHAKAQGISFGNSPPKTKEVAKETLEVGTRTGINSQKKQGGLLADLLGVDPLGRPGQNGNFANNGGQNGNNNNFQNNNGGQNGNNNNFQNNNGGQNGNNNNFPNNNGGQNGNNNNFPNNDGQNGRNGQNCCCTRNNFCPSTNGQLGNGDEDGFSGLKPRRGPEDKEDTKRKANVGVRSGSNVEEKKNFTIAVRIVNNAPDEQNGGCPSGTRQCCYNSNININSFGNVCASQSPPWDQGCLQRVPRNGGKQCGQRFYSPLQNLKKGQASPEEFPWICMMLTDTDRFLGSCAIIPEDDNNDISKGTYRVITAAHKLGSLKQNEQLKVRIIEYDGSGYNPQNGERTPHEDYTVARFIVHPSFNKKRLSDDIAVIILETPIDLVNRQGNLEYSVNAACLPACGNMFEYQFRNETGVRCWVAGWGRDGEDGQFSFVQRKVDVPIFNRQRCENVMKRELSNRFRLRSGEICAGGEENKDSCDGDGGSPLVCQSEEGNWHVVGLVAWGVGCAKKDIPGMYVNVYHYRDFITSPQHRRRIDSRNKPTTAPRNEQPVPSNLGVRSGGEN